MRSASPAKRRASPQQWKGIDMGIFSNILAKLGFGGDDQSAAAAPAAAPEGAAPATAAPAAPVAISVVDVLGQLEALAALELLPLTLRPMRHPHGLVRVERDRRLGHAGRGRLGTWHEHGR